jgi:hypothetical protein
MLPDVSTVRMDKSVFSVASLTDPPDEPGFWRSKSPDERLIAIELMRQAVYGYHAASTRLQRVFTTAELKAG